MLFVPICNYEVTFCERKLGFSFTTKPEEQNPIELNRTPIGNRTKSNIYFAMSSIIEQNRTQPDSILFGIHLLTPENK